MKEMMPINREHMQLGAYLQKLDARVWSRFGAIAVILGAMMYLFVWN
jgi:hypothetical protein